MAIDPLDPPRHMSVTKLLAPDCRDGKHPPAGPTTDCKGWDLELDTYCPCPCACHTPLPAEVKDGWE
jgi:hypothetical protein